MNFRLHKADDILPFVIYFTVYVTVGMDPLLRSCNIFLAETSHKRTCLLVVDPLTMPRVLPPHVSCTLLAMASRASFISMNVLASIHTNSISLSFFRFDTKVWRGRLISKKVSANVIRCHQMSDIHWFMIFLACSPER